MNKLFSTRRLFSLLFIAAMVFSLVGCGGSNEKVIEREAAPKSSGSDAPMTSENAQAETAASGFVFIYNGVRIDMDAEASAIVSSLGEPVSYFEAASCAFDGLDKMYTYGGFELDTYPTDNRDYVSAIVFRDDSVTTPEGVMIGDSTEKLQQVYGAPASSSGNLVTYAAGNMELRFILDGDIIASIEYISLVAAAAN